MTTPDSKDLGSREPGGGPFGGPLDESRPKRAPEPFGKYMLTNRIGAGGMAEVFQAIVGGPEGFQRTLVIKRMLPHLSSDEVFVRMFVDEAKLSGLLSHPNLVQIFEFGSVGSSFFIAMEYVHGRTLSAVTARLAETNRAMPIGASVEIARQMCVGLAYAHALKGLDGRALGIVHRDISPPNLMLSFHGQVKILDFGIARVAEEMREHRTQAGMMKGKISYASPEQLRLEPIDHRSDVFAVGIVLHEMLTGQRLFRATSEYTSSRMVLDMPIPRPSEQNPAVPPELDRIVMAALERNRDARLPAAEMAAQLDGVAAEMRYSPREHVRLLHDLFPDEVLRVPENPPLGPAPSAAIGAPLREADESPTGAVVHAALHDSVTTANGLPSGARRRRIVARATTAAAAVVLGAAAFVAARWAPMRAGAPAPSAEVTGATPRAAALVHLSIDSSPQEAQVTRLDTGQVLGKTPVTVSLPYAPSAIAFRFEKPGYTTVIYKAIADLDKTVRADLLPEPTPAPAAPEPPPAPEPAPTAAATPAPAPAQPEAAPEEPHVAASARAPGARRAAHAPALPTSALEPPPMPAPAHEPEALPDCSMTIGSTPWAELWIDGKDTGRPTPAVHVLVSCGPHELRFTRDNPAIDRVIKVNVTDDKELRQNFQLIDSDSDSDD